MMNELLEYADACYKNENTYGCKNKDSCNNCLKKVHYSESNEDYSCPQIISYYICRYYPAYTYQMMRAYANILDFFKNNRRIDMLSVGCGAGPDFLAVCQVLKEKKLKTKVNYIGFDHNPLWEPFQTKVSEFGKKEGYKAEFYYNDAVDIFVNKKIGGANLIVFQYIFSNMIHLKQHDQVVQLLKASVKNVVQYMNKEALIIIEDIDSKTVMGQVYAVLQNEMSSLKGWSYTKKECYFLNNYYKPGDLYVDNDFADQVPQKFKVEYETMTKGRSRQVIYRLRRCMI